MRIALVLLRQPTGAYDVFYGIALHRNFTELNICEQALDGNAQRCSIIESLHAPAAKIDLSYQ